EFRRVLFRSEHRVDVETGADVAGRIDGAALDGAASVGGVDVPEVLDRRRKDQCARDRVAGDAAAEAVDLAGQLLFLALAHEVDVGEDAAVGTVILSLVAHAGEQPAVGRLDLDLTADLAGERNRRIVVVHALVEPLQVERDLRAGAGDLEHDADRLEGVVGPRGLRRRTADSNRSWLLGRVERLELVPRHLGHAAPSALEYGPGLSGTGLISRQNRRSPVYANAKTRPASQPIRTERPTANSP